MKQHVYILFALGFVALSLLGCTQRGCTDPQASNFDQDATESDGSCDYYGLVHFWIDSSSSQALHQVSNDDLIYVYVDNNLMNAIDINDYLTEVPACGSGWMTKRISVAKNSSQTVSYHMTHLSSTSGQYEVFQSGNMVVVQGDCVQQQVVF